jgi:hypothetical protein
MNELEKLSKKDIFECYGYAFNTLFLGPRFCEHLIAAGMQEKQAVEFSTNIAADLLRFAEEHARNMLRQGKMHPEER